MGKIIIITFAFMTFAFYELSGGSDFVAIADEKRAAHAVERAEEERLLAQAKAERLKANPTPAAPAQPEIVLASAVMTPVDATPEVAAVDPVAEAVALALDDTKAEIVTQAEPEVAEAQETFEDIREVTAARVNMRDGPGQTFDVIAKLTNGERVQILQDPGDGWVKLRVSDSGREGWMADFLLTASNN